MSRRTVVVTELRSQLDPRAVALHDEAIAAGVDPGPLKATRLYSAVVTYDGTVEVWSISKQDAKRIVAEFESQREADLLTEKAALRALHPVTIDLPEPPQGAPRGWDDRLLFAT